MIQIVRNWRTSLCGAALIFFGLDAFTRGWLTLEQVTPWIITGVGLLTARDASSVDWQTLVRQTLQARQQQAVTPPPARASAQQLTPNLDSILPEEAPPK